MQKLRVTSYVLLLCLSLSYLLSVFAPIEYKAAVSTNSFCSSTSSYYKDYSEQWVCVADRYFDSPAIFDLDFDLVSHSSKPLKFEIILVSLSDQFHEDIICKRGDGFVIECETSIFGECINYLDFSNFRYGDINFYLLYENDDSWHWGGSAYLSGDHVVTLGAKSLSVDDDVVAVKFEIFASPFDFVLDYRDVGEPYNEIYFDMPYVTYYTTQNYAATPPSSDSSDEQLQVSTNIFENVVQIVQYVFSLPSKIAESLGSLFENVKNGISQSVSSIGSNIVNGLINLRDILTERINLLKESLGLLPGAIKQAFDSFLTSIDENLFGIKGIISNIQTGQNALFGLVGSVVQNVLDGMYALWIPDKDVLEEYYSKMSTLLEERFTLFYEVVNLVHDYFSQMVAFVELKQLYIEKTTYNLMGYDFEFGGWSVDLVPEGMDYLRRMTRLAIDMVCTCLFVNTMFDKSKEMFR